MNKQPDDTGIKKNISKKLSLVSWDASDIHLAVNNGQVILTGTVADKESLHLAETLVWETRDVTQVDNQLKIRGGGIAAILSEIAADVSTMMRGNHPGEKPDN